MSQELLPCPFCQTKLVSRQGYFCHENVGTDCILWKTEIDASDDKLISRWNTRAPVVDTVKEKLVKALKIAEPWMKNDIEDTEWEHGCEDVHKAARRELAFVRAAIASATTKNEEGVK